MSNSKLRRPPNAAKAPSSAYPDFSKSTSAPNCASTLWQPTSRATDEPHTSTTTVTCLYDCALVLCLPTILFAIGVAFYLASSAATPTDPKESDNESIAFGLGNGYREVLGSLWAAGNESFDPCRDFYMFACYKYRRGGESGFASPALGKGLLGFSQTDPGRVLFIYYQTCTAAQYKQKEAPKQAVRALFETFSLPLTRLGIFAFVMKANLKYGLHGSLTIFQYLYGLYPRDLPHAALFNRPLQLYVLATPGPFSLPILSLPSTGVNLRGIVEELGAQLKTNLTLRQLKSFSSALYEVRGDATRESDVGVLDDIVPTVSARLWKDTVEACTTVAMSDRVAHSPLNVLAHRLRILLDERDPALAVAFMVTEMAFDLLRSSMDVKNDVTGSHEFCAMQSLSLMPVWAINALLLFEAKTEHNQAIATLFDLLKEAIATEVKEIVDPGDAALADRKVRNLTLVLPYHVFPLDLEFPNLGAGYFANVLQVRGYRLTSKTYRTPPGVLQSLAYGNDVWSNARTPGFVYIPTTVYTALALDHKSVLLRSAVMGFMMADLIWSDVVDTDWTQRSSADRLAQASCDSSVSRGSWVKRPHLALRSCSRVASGPGWHDLRHYLGQWHFSLSQVFYRLVAFNYYCFGRSSSQLIRRLVLSDVTRHNADFNEAFRCPGNTSEPCGLERH